jgi:DNA polymerase III epsilon subunit-like protein
MDAVDLRSYISVDVEASGPGPGLYSMLSLGGCSVADPSQTFYAELRPTSDKVDAGAMATHGLNLEDLKRSGVDLSEAMARFESWVLRTVPAAHKPIFVSYNAPFDWMFVNDGFLRALGRNPFGHAPLDIRAFVMGQTRQAWISIRLEDLLDHHLAGRRLSHNALEDAQLQAELFRALMGSGPERG